MQPLKMGSDARNLGRIDLNVARAASARGSRAGDARRRGSRARFKLQSADFQAIPVTDAIAEDSGVAAIVGECEKQLNASLGEVIGKTSVALDARASVIRFGESNLGKFLADVYKQAVRADCALVKSGGIRSDTTYGPGDLTKKDILSILPVKPEDGPVEPDVVMEAVKKIGTIAPQVEGRIKSAPATSRNSSPRFSTQFYLVGHFTARIQR